jgi:hypothetical protein
MIDTRTAYGRVDWECQEQAIRLTHHQSLHQSEVSFVLAGVLPLSRSSILLTENLLFCEIATTSESSMITASVTSMLLVSLTFLAINYPPSFDDIELGKETIVSTSIEGGKLKCEPSAAMTDDAIIVTWNDSYGGMCGCGTVGTAVGWSISGDGGKSFEFGGYLPELRDHEASCAADSWLRVDEDGNFYVSILSVQADKHEIQMYLMPRGNLRQWKRLPNVAAVMLKNNGGLDRPSMSLNRTGRIGVAYTYFPSTFSYLINFAVSPDRGNTWNRQITISDTTKKSRLCANVVFHGDTVWVVWLEGASYVLNELWWTMSLNGGQRFERPELLYRLRHTNPPAPKGYNMSSGLGPVILIDPPSLAVRATRQGKTTIDLVCAEATAQGSKILLFEFDRENNTWSTPDPVGQSPDSAYKIFPSISSNAGSRAVLYYDRRNDNGISITDVYLTALRNDARIDVKLNGASTVWETTAGDSLYAPVQRTFGDYITLTSYHDKYLATWTDGRNGKTAIYSRLITLK